jgi:hypothetical protein
LSHLISITTILCQHKTGFVTRLTRRVPLVEQELFTRPEHLSSPPHFSGLRITQSLGLCVCVIYTGVEFENIKEVIRIHKSKKNRQHNDQKDKQRSTKHICKTKDRVNRTSIKPT